MKLFEHEAKTILAKYKIPIPKGGLATSPTQAEEIAKQIGKACVVKAQVFVAGRGKAGGILFANEPSQIKSATEKLLKTKIKEISVRSVLVEEKYP